MMTLPPMDQAKRAYVITCVNRKIAYTPLTSPSRWRQRKRIMNRACKEWARKRRTHP